MTELQMTLLDQLIMTGTVVRDITMLEGTVKATLQTLTAEQQLNVESLMKTIEGTPLFALHTYSIKLLSYGLKKFTYKGQELIFKTADEAEQFLRSKPSVLVDELINEHKKLEKELNDLISGPGIVENFTKTPSAGSDQK